MRRNVYHPSWILLASLGAVCFWSSFAEVMRPSEPHPGLRDEALKQALRTDRSHEALSYYQARKHLFGSIDGDGKRAECVYTGATLEYFRQPLPNDALIEHAWPPTRLPAEARSDLHHMFAVDAEARVARLNLHYGRVVFPVWAAGGSRSGPSAKLKPVFGKGEDASMTAGNSTALTDGAAVVLVAATPAESGAVGEVDIEALWLADDGDCASLTNIENGDWCFENK